MVARGAPEVQLVSFTLDPVTFLSLSTNPILAPSFPQLFFLSSHIASFPHSSLVKLRSPFPKSSRIHFSLVLSTATDLQRLNLVACLSLKYACSTSTFSQRPLVSFPLRLNSTLLRTRWVTDLHWKFGITGGTLFSELTPSISRSIGLMAPFHSLLWTCRTRDHRPSS